MHDAELPITGYLDRLSCRPGEALAAKVSVRDGTPYRVTLQRLICADPNPAGPGRQVEDLAAVFTRDIAGRRQPIARGSHAAIPAGPDRPRTVACTWSALVAPGRTDADQAVLSEADATCSVVLGVGPHGTFARLGGLTVHTGSPLQPKHWYRVWLSADPATGAMVVGQTRLEDEATAIGTATAPDLVLPSGGRVLIAAEEAGAHFTGKIEDPAIFAGFSDTPPEGLPVLARWDFARDIAGLTVTDIGPSACHGAVVNLPCRGMVGATWTGRETCWRHAPEDYAAIHFHADDLNDCGWQTDFTFAAPAGLRSGCYMLHLECAAGEDWLPFYVLPPRHGPSAPIVFLASTFTYIAYANHARGNTDMAFRARVADWGAYPHNPDDYPV